MKAATPQLKQFAHSWTLTGQPLGRAEWSTKEKVRRAKAAGFDAFAGTAQPEVAEAAHMAGMDYICYVDVNDTNYRERLEMAAATRPARVNVQLLDHDTAPRVAAQTWIKMQPLAAQLGLEIDLEIHRDTSTETPEKTWKIAHLYQQATGKKCQFCFDFSHLAVIKHLAPPFADRLLEHSNLIHLSRQMHFRPFNGHHCQIPFTDGAGHISGEGWPYLDFLDALLACWLDGARAGDVLYACLEFGPVIHGYGLSTFPDVWKDAIHLRAEVERLWRKNLAKRKNSSPMVDAIPMENAEAIPRGRGKQASK